MRRYVFALVDCDNFYASCQRVFDGTIRQRPVVVLSNNDSCVIARSKEAKALGIAMGMPYFQCRGLIERHRVVVFSANYALYQDMSDRVMAVLARFTSAQEVYSIDECWLDLSHVPVQDLESYGQAIRKQVLQETGIVVSVGIANTKVLSKIACELVKRHMCFGGVLSLALWSEEDLDGWLRGIAVQDVWGIGPRLAQRLQAIGIASAQALKQADHAWIRHAFHVGVQRVVLELQGMVCIPLEIVPKPRKGIMVAWSFGRVIEALEELEEAVATYAASATEKVRRQGSLARRVNVFLQASSFEQGRHLFTKEASARLPFASAFTPDILDLALALLGTIYQPGQRYRRAGIFLSELCSREVMQRDIFGLVSPHAYERQACLMELVDEVNARWGRNTLFFSSQGNQRAWFMRQERRSQRWTTHWNEILQVSAT